MKVAGVMSGTSLDGIDVAIVDIEDKRRLKITPVAFRSTPYPKAVREALLAVSNTITHTATIARLNFLLGELYAAAIQDACRRARIKVDLIGMHGQTIFHEASPVEYLGACISSTMQIGEAAVVAERTGIATVSNFRERDMAAGGKGAPLVPYVDYLLFRNRRSGRVALNIGGIANISVIRAGASRDDVIAFDTGPGNIVIDALVAHYTGEHFDRNGRIARTGNIHPRLLESMLSDPYFALPPPKACGREQYGREFVSGLIATSLPLPDLIATATEMTAQSIALAIAPHNVREVIASGGGVHNRTLMRRIADLLPDVRISTSAEFGIDPDAKEAIAFAVLAHEAVHGRAANLPSATGARRAVLLGKISRVS